MRDFKQYSAAPAGVAQLGEFWSAHLDALERHLSARMWALAAVTLVTIVYPIARIVIPAILQGLVPDVVRSMINLI